MKKSFSIFAAALLVFAACDNKTLEPKGSTYEANFTVAPQLVTKATVDGEGVNVNRFIMEVWRVKDGKEELYTRKVNKEDDVIAGTSENAPANTKFTVSLVKGQQYDILFWADYGVDGSDSYYGTESLYAVTVKSDGYVSNDDKRDAFSKYLSVASDATADVLNQTISLERPFGQLNLITTDIADIAGNTRGDSFIPDNVTVSYEAPSQFNVKTGEATGSAEYSYNAKPYYLANEEAAKEAGKYTLSMDYILAPLNSENANVIDVKLSAAKGEDVLNTQDFSSIPLYRNYRTNVIGALLTISGQFTVQTSPVWTAEKDVDSNGKLVSGSDNSDSSDGNSGNEDQDLGEE